MAILRMGGKCFNYRDCSSFGYCEAAGQILLRERRAPLRNPRGGTGERRSSYPGWEPVELRLPGVCQARGLVNAVSLFKCVAIRHFIIAVETPKTSVAVVAAIRPDKRDPEPGSFDKPFPCRSPHRTAAAHRALANPLGKNQMHGGWITFRFRVDKYAEARPIPERWVTKLCAADILTARTGASACTVMNLYCAESAGAPEIHEQNLICQELKKSKLQPIEELS